MELAERIDRWRMRIVSSRQTETAHNQQPIIEDDWLTDLDDPRADRVPIDLTEGVRIRIEWHPRFLTDNRRWRRSFVSLSVGKMMKF